MTMSPDCKPWVVIAIKVLNGHYIKANRSTRDSLLIGLKGLPGDHKVGQRAIALLESMKGLK